MDIIVSPGHVELGKIMCTFEVMDQVINERERVVILVHNSIEGVVVLHKVKLAILLLDEKG
jgi:hypothetical protein